MEFTNVFAQQIQTGLESMGFKASVRDLSSFQDDYGLKVGDDEEGDDDDDEEDGEEGDDDDEDDEDDEEDNHDKDK